MRRFYYEGRRYVVTWCTVCSLTTTPELNTEQNRFEQQALIEDHWITQHMEILCRSKNSSKARELRRETS